VDDVRWLGYPGGTCTGPVLFLKATRENVKGEGIVLCMGSILDRTALVGLSVLKVLSRLRTRGSMGLELVKRNASIYWILNFPFYGKFVFYGNPEEAEEIFMRYSKHEGAGVLRRADSKNKEDVLFVREEIDNVLEDRRAGIKNLPYLPREGGF